MNIIFLGIFAVVVVIYLVSLFFKQGVFQAVVKACLMPLVLAVYVSGANSIFFPVVLALVFGWIGDIFLVKIEDIRFFRRGLTSFLLGHICYIPSMLHFAGKLNIPILGISLLVAAALGVLMIKIIRPSREMNISTIVYETVIILMAASALQLFMARGAPFGALVFAGSLCFLVSDSMLAFFTFRGKPKDGFFLVMLTYIAAQFCIVLGLSGL
ncbi:hypothetical protein AGMMS50293_06020 [Spirochaetia bacterium]|nr:hypothetical protein AGMMS50293_06020 [Spirochaetia bacterium]